MFQLFRNSGVQTILKRAMRTACLFDALRLLATLHLAQAFSQSKSQSFAGVRFSLYPNVAKEVPPSLKQAVKDAVVGLKDLGIQINADDVSSCLVGHDHTLFEALRSCFSRASLTSDGNPRGVSMVATFSAGCHDLIDVELPARNVRVDDGKQNINQSYLQPRRIAAQFAVYPMGVLDFHATIDKVVENAKKSACWVAGKDAFCDSFMLDGDGNEVFDILQKSFTLLQAECEQVKMTVTMTANKNAWPVEDRSPLQRQGLGTNMPNRLTR